MLDIQGNGLWESRLGKGKEDRYYQMAQFTKVGGRIIKLTERAGSLMLMETFMKGSG